jgi:hypothetical protein
VSLCIAAPAAQDVGAFVDRARLVHFSHSLVARFACAVALILCCVLHLGALQAQQRRTWARMVTSGT